MIEFTCSCGKKYRLPPRNAGREVRCNQCEKTLIVPGQSQTAPIVPVGEQPEPSLVQEAAKPKVEPKVESVATPVAVTPQSIVAERKSSPVAAASPFTAVPITAVPASSMPDSPIITPPDRRSGFPFGILIVLFVSILVVSAICFVVGRFSVGTPLPKIEYVESVVVPPPPPRPAADDWKTGEDSLPLFDIRTADGVPAKLSLDGDPTAEKSGKQSTLAEIAVALDDDQAIKGQETHTISLRIDSESGKELCVVWPKSRNAGLDEDEIKELKFCIYFSGTANKDHNPGKPEGLDKTLELADFRLRIGDAFGDTEFVLAEKERINLCEKGRITWFAVSVPIDGNDRWQRTERGRMTPKTVDFIEFRAKPTGSGVTFWIDNLSIRGE